MPNYFFENQVTCAKCGGTGIVENPVWPVYLATRAKGLPAHRPTHHVVCNECQGNGKHSERVELTPPEHDQALKELDLSQPEDRLYDHAGFTHAVDHILPTPAEDGIIRFTITSDQAFEILKLLPCLATDTQNNSPTFAEFVAAGRLFPDLRFLGYRVSDTRFDERITLEGYLAPAAIASEVLLHWATAPDYCHYNYDQDYPDHYQVVWD